MYPFLDLDRNWIEILYPGDDPFQLRHAQLEQCIGLGPVPLKASHHLCSDPGIRFRERALGGGPADLDHASRQWIALYDQAPAARSSCSIGGTVDALYSGVGARAGVRVGDG